MRRTITALGRAFRTTAARAALCVLVLPGLLSASTRVGIYLHACDVEGLHADPAVRGRFGPVVLHNHDCRAGAPASRRAPADCGVRPAGRVEGSARHRHLSCPDVGIDIVHGDCPAEGCCESAGVFVFGSEASARNGDNGATERTHAATPAVDGALARRATATAQAPDRCGPRLSGVVPDRISTITLRN
jgi:hypothetical protein